MNNSETFFNVWEPTIGTMPEADRRNFASVFQSALALSQDNLCELSTIFLDYITGWNIERDDRWIKLNFEIESTWKDMVKWVSRDTIQFVAGILRGTYETRDQAQRIYETLTVDFATN